MSSLLERWERLKWLEASIEGRPWHVSHGRMDEWMTVPLEGRSAHGQVFGCWGRDPAETARTYEFVTLSRNLLPELMAQVERLIGAADLVVAGVNETALANLLAALNALREVSGIPDTGHSETGGEG